MNHWDIYLLPCQCGLAYIAQTRETLKFCVKYIRCVSKPETANSAVDFHS